MEHGPDRAGSGRADDDALHPAVVRWLAAYAKAASDEVDAPVVAILEDLDAALKCCERRAGQRTPAE